MSANDDGPLDAGEASRPEQQAPAVGEERTTRQNGAHGSATPGDGSPSDERPGVSTWTSPVPASPTARSVRPTEVTMKFPPIAGIAHRGPHETMRPPQNPTAPPLRQPGSEPGGWASWRSGPQPAGPPANATGAYVGHDRAIDALLQVGARSAVKRPPRRGWRHLLYLLTRINLGPSPDELDEMALHARIRRTVRGSYQIGVFGLKGGIGKTAVTVALGSSLSSVRGDRILAVDADPDGGNLADRVGRQSAATIADLLSDEDVARYNDIRAYTHVNGSNLEVLSSEEYSGARREFNDEDWKGAVGIVSRYYNLVLADCGGGLFQPATRGVLSTVSGLVIVSSASIDGARQAAVTMDWLRQNGYQDLLVRSCVVINHVAPGKPNVDVEDLVRQFERHIPVGRVIVLPWDRHIASGMEIQFDLLGGQFRRRITELAAALSDDFDKVERRRPPGRS